MKWVKTIGAVLLALWVVFVTTSTTITAHSCSMKGTTELAVNGKVECDHAHKHVNSEGESKHKCKHHCKHHASKDETPLDKGVKSNCCSETVFTFFVPTESQEQEVVQISDVQSVVASAVPVIDVEAINTEELPYFEKIPPPLIPRGTKAFLTRIETFLI